MASSWSITYLALNILLSTIEHSLDYRFVSVNYRPCSSVKYRTFCHLSKTLLSSIERLWITRDIQKIFSVLWG